MFGTQVNLLARAFGCWHSRLGRPITFGGETYRVCVGCGARRLFDTEKWECYGPYFYDESPGRLAPARLAAGLELRRAG